MLTAAEFFAGSGLVGLGLSSQFKTVWANDNCEKKRNTYIANHGSSKFVLADIRKIHGSQIPVADLAWASFPCQDLSLAGNLNGMAEGTRSGLFWEWVRILWELREADKLPSVLVAENVVGFLSAAQGRHFSQACRAIKDLGFRIGAVTVDAGLFVPQSRPRAFLIAVRDGVPLDGLSQSAPTALFHSSAVVRASTLVNDPKWVWWSLPVPNQRKLSFSALCEQDAPVDSPEKTADLCNLLSQPNQRKLDAALQSKGFLVGTAYRRTRPDLDGNKSQRLEIRFDGLAGCLRTPNGGSSRQVVILVSDGKVSSRLMTARECARLMGAPDSYKLVGTYNDRYRAMGDAVAVPVTRWLSEHLLSPLARRLKQTEGCGSIAPLEPWMTTSPLLPLIEA